MVSYRNLESLTASEHKACAEYQADSTFLHATFQGWNNGQFTDSAALQRFNAKAAQIVNGLTSAIQKFEITSQATLYSGRPRRNAVIGPLRADPRRFVGLRYRYPGFLATTDDRAAAENFLRTRSDARSAPVLLKVNLNMGQKGLPLEATNRCW